MLTLAVGVSIFVKKYSVGFSVASGIDLFRLSVIFLFLILSKPPRSFEISWKSTVWVTLSFVSPIFISIDRQPDGILLLTAFGSASAFYLGFIISAYFSLGSNLGVFPGKRNLVTSGFFTVVRHPIYSGYIHFMAGLVSIDPSVGNFFWFLVFALSVYQRALAEENHLRNYPDYSAFMLVTRNRVFSVFVSMPLLVLVTVVVARQSPHKLPEPLRLLMAYPVMSLDPRIYDDWSSLFIANHIFVRLIAEPDRGIPGIFQKLNPTCIFKESDGSCRRARVEFEWRPVVDCGGKEVPPATFSKEFFQILRFHNWILPNLAECENSYSGADRYPVCLEFDYVKDFDRRMRNVYFRFGWSLPITGAPFGTGQYCMIAERRKVGGEIEEGQLYSRERPKEKIVFATGAPEGQRFEVNLYGLPEPPSDDFTSVESNTPLSYFLVSNHRRSDACPIWQSDRFLKVIRNLMQQSGTVFSSNETADFSFFGELPSHGCEEPQNLEAHDTAPVFLPNYISGCGEIADALKEKFKNYQLDVRCVDTTRFIQESVVSGKNNWSAFVSPLSPGYPGPNAIQNQYFSSGSRMSWVRGAKNPHRHFFLIGVGKSFLTVKKALFCGLRASPLGLGDFQMGDLRRCD